MVNKNVSDENETRIDLPARNSQGPGWDTDDEM
jgi:hypothetical protein